MAYGVAQLTLTSSPVDVINYAIGKTLAVNITSQITVTQTWWTGKRGRDGNIRKPLYDYFLQFNGVTIQTFRLSDRFSSQGTSTVDLVAFQHRIPAGTKGQYKIFISQPEYPDRLASWGAVSLELNINFIRATAVGFV